MRLFPSAIDALLAEKNLAERMITQRSSALHGMVKTELEAEDKLKKLDCKLETPLLGGGNLDRLLEGQIPGAVARSSDQQDARRQASQEANTDTMQQKHILDRFSRSSEQDSADNTRQPKPGRPTYSYASRKTSDALQADTDGVKKQRIQTRLKAKKAKLYTVPRHEQKRNVQRQSSDKDRAKSSIGPVVAAQIDTKQARDKMARRVKKAGVASAWYSPIDLSLQQQQAKQSDEKIRQQASASATNDSGTTSHNPAYAGLKKIKPPDTDSVTSNKDGQKPSRTPVAEQQIEHYINKLVPQKHSDFKAASEKRQKKSATVPASDHPQKPGARQKNEETMRDKPLRQFASQCEHDASHESTRQAPGMGGLRGLAAQANGPLEQASNAAVVGDITSQQNKPLPTRANNEVSTMAGGKSENALAELAELLADEARRAGIDLEQFHP